MLYSATRIAASAISARPGLSNAPLDGIWRRPYCKRARFHAMGSAAAGGERPRTLSRNDLYDPRHLGSSRPSISNGKALFAFVTTLPAMAIAGHEGAAYGTTLPDADKWACWNT